jgi:tRNA 2-thiouridine synthesizing protein A
MTQTNTELLYHVKLDTSNLICPMPLLKAKLALKSLSAGQILMVVATDASSVIDFKAFTRQTTNNLLKSWQEGQKYYFLLQKN